VTEGVGVPQLDGVGVGVGVGPPQRPPRVRILTAEQLPPVGFCGVGAPQVVAVLATPVAALGAAAAVLQPLDAPPQLPPPVLSWTKPQPPMPLQSFDPRQLW
jgi:hypothetical protein